MKNISKIFLGLIAIVAVVFISFLNNSPTITPAPSYESLNSNSVISNSLVQPQNELNTLPVLPTSEENSGLSNDNHYVNVDDDSIHSPAYSNSVPAGATAQCRDGTYSFSQHRSGTCSHHGGVAQWL